MIQVIANTVAKIVLFQAIFVSEYICAKMFRSKSVFEKTLDKATSNLLLEPDLDCMLQLCDMIRGGDVKVRDAANHIKNKVIEEKNPNQKLLAVSVLDTVMKNCGSNFHAEIITETFLEKLKDLLKNNRTEVLKTKLLEMIQCWGLAFRDTKLKTAYNFYNILKAEGYSFPAEKSVQDMFKSESAPVWREGDECMSCKVEFGVVTRKHHCRACGGIFCNKCTSKQAIIPKFGIEKEVRVCDSCYVQLTTKKGKSKVGSSAGSSRAESDLPIEYLQSALFKESHDPPKKTEAELKEEEELQLALALSLDEQANRDQIKREKNNDSMSAPIANVKKLSPAESPNKTEDPDLAHYFDRAYWEKKKEKQEQQASLQNGRSSPVAIEKTSNAMPQVQVVQESLVTTSEEDKKFLVGLRTSVEIFMNRMKSNQIRGRPIAHDSAVQTLFQSVNSMHPRILQMLNDLEEKRLHEESLQDKVTQMKDARAALDALRADHAEKMRREAEEAERLRQAQMAHKLQVMRQKKQEFLAQQRQMALQRMQEQEAARKAKLEQQKQYIQQRTMQNHMGYDQQMQNFYYGPQQDMQQQAAGAPPPQVFSSNQYQNPNMYQNMQQQAYYPGYSDTASSVSNSHQQQPAQVMAYQQGGYMPPQPDYYSMQGMQGALPQQPASTAPMMSNSQHIIASAPPQTPQPAPSYQMIDTGSYQMTPSTQQAYPVADNSQPPPSAAIAQPQANAENDKNLLISFD